MAFQFMCPQGHLLEGDESQAGHQCQCPQCGMMFLIPTPAPAPGTGPAPVLPGEDFGGEQAVDDGGFPMPAPRFAEFGGDAASDAGPGGLGLNTASVDEEGPAGLGVELGAEAEPRVLVIPCPRGHELEVPEELLNQQVRCPTCNAKFVLLERNSLEAKKKRRAEYHQYHQKQADRWLYWAIALGVIVVIGVVAMFVLSMVR
jgi:DNA-directed RNA polymerase subunit RPC12/RpoP